jgi:hypothetical protein
MTDEAPKVDQPTPPINISPADLTPAEKVALNERTNAMLELAKVTVVQVQAMQGQIDAVAMLVELRQQKAALEALIDLLLSAQLVVVGEPDPANPDQLRFGASPLNRKQFFEVCALRAEQQASNIRKMMLTMGSIPRPAPRGNN